MCGGQAARSSTSMLGVTADVTSSGSTDNDWIGDAGAGDADCAARDGTVAFGVIWLTVSEIGYDASTSAGALAFGDATVAACTSLNGVPSTGQKLNRSANCSWHVLQNFILTTSLSRWGSMTELRCSFMLIVAC